MCGIAGKSQWKGVSEDTIAAVSRMCNSIKHRGPDNQGVKSLGNIVLGHRRLSIIDLSANANQPMSSKDERFNIVYNGEIYNFMEIKNDLIQHGYSFKTNSDTEVIIYAYDKFGSDCFSMFNGMFSLAIWDSKLNELILARDRFGKKPLYYYFDKNKNISFASELKAFKEDKTFSPELSYEALNCYLAIGYILAPLTIYKNIFKLEAAHYMKISDSGNKISKLRYWDYSDSFRIKNKDSDEDTCSKILYLLEESVKRRMISDVPVGAFLSGGIDSTSIVALMKKFHKGELHTFSVGFNQKSYNELPDADRAAEFIGTRHHGIICDIKNELDFLNNAVDVFDEPFADNSLIPMIEVSKLASDFVTVVLSGDGADEIFAGYITYKADKYYNFAKPIPDSIKRFIIGLNSNSKNKNKLNWQYKQKQFLNGALHSPEKAHYLWRQFFSPEERIEILGKEYKDLVYDTDPYNTFKKYYDIGKELDTLDRNLYVDGMTWLTDDILVKVDRTTMHSSIEARSPYLDPELVEYVSSIPSNKKMKGMQLKYILKKALKDVIPEFVINKKKSGFNSPVGEWIGSNGNNEFKTFNKYVYDRKFN
ncbi:MAG TPA: asparagine synthase (glutamine-hydrolyzing) [Ignavibacteria bacterium]|nr:asparagine synthase (glutamine-hydrolyzing) [Ignavibacteria bacterium]HRA98952.1 asparagine synthase (glutamine-hydrolyzing) [Ignavibacteria bacterium]